MGRLKQKKQRIILPPELPPELSEDEIEVSDEDLQFVEENRDYAGFVARLDTQSITKHVTRVADVGEDALETLYEKRLQKKTQQEKQNTEPEVDPVDVLPVKTLDGKLYYRTLSKSAEAAQADEDDGQDGSEDDATFKSIIRTTKAERREKVKQSRKEAKHQAKELLKTEESTEITQAAVLAEVKKDLTAEQVFENKKHKLAELGMALLSDPEANIKSLKEMLEITKDENPSLVKLSLLSLLAVFKDIIPGYRIRLPTEKELEMKVSKEVKKMRFYESTLLKSYKAYLQKLFAFEKKLTYHQTAIRCICSLLDSVPHFNYSENLLVTVVKNIGGPDGTVRRLCCSTVRSLFLNEGKHGGELTVQSVRLVADLVKANDCHLHPESIEIFSSLKFDDDLGKPDKANEEDNNKYKRNKKRKNVDESTQAPENNRKKTKREMVSKLREEVAADYKSAALTADITERRRMQTETISAVFETYFRVLRHTMQLTMGSSEATPNVPSTAFGPHPLLSPCLDGLGKFSHLLDLDYIGDLMLYLKRLASASNGSCQKALTVSERLRCCIIAFKVMKTNLDALNVDLHEFSVQLYNLILEYRPGRDQGQVLAEALKTMLCEDRHHDMQKAAAFVKRLATFSLAFGCAESMAALVTVKHLLQKNVKCRNLLENDAGGGSVSGFIAKYQPDATDPNQSGALASVLWELDLLVKHYHPTISTMARNLSTNNAAQNQVYLSIVSPQQGFRDFSLEHESFNLKVEGPKSIKRKKGTTVCSIETMNTPKFNEGELSKKAIEHFSVLRSIRKSEKLRGELQRVNACLGRYEEYERQKKQRLKKPTRLKNSKKIIR